MTAPKITNWILAGAAIEKYSITIERVGLPGEAGYHWIASVPLMFDPNGPWAFGATPFEAIERLLEALGNDDTAA